ncbi:hypothetical protein POTOM_058734 [Populus tomentosa]|uniref:Uncharacterized protein n=1 Tax=Populus tomentosa TaxID=118781 RepID=A0A8X7XRQ7_POPTO|nr:hypothetical protein POTOM_058734 [Populus tomentosa]
MRALIFIALQGVCTFPIFLSLLIKYSISIVADKGLKKPLYTSARLKKGEVLYLETHSCRYELCFTGEKMGKVTQASLVHEQTDKFHSHHPHSSNGEKHDCDNVLIDVFWWSRCIEENLDWEDVQGLLEKNTHLLGCLSISKLAMASCVSTNSCVTM